MRRVVNHHKIIRKVSRNVHKSKKWWHVFRFGRARIRRDFSWHETGHQNPFIRRPDEQGHKKRVSVELVLALLFLGIMSGILYMHPFFQVTRITITGLDRIDEHDVRSTLDGILDYKHIKLFSDRDYFLLDVNEIRDILKERFPIERIVVIKKFPHYLYIDVQEKLSTIIYDNGDKYAYMDDTGHVVEILKKVGQDEWKTVTHTITTTTLEYVPTVMEITTVALDGSTREVMQTIATTTEQMVTSTIDVSEQVHIPATKDITESFGNYPLVYDMRGHDISLNTIALTTTEAQTLIQWYQRLARWDDIPFKYFEIQDDMGTIKIQTYAGWYILTKLEYPVDSEVGKLEQLFKDKLDMEKIHYIDMRYTDRIFWQ